MSRIDELKSEIEKLPSEEYSEIIRWAANKAWEEWDKQFAADAHAGKLDFLRREALEEKAKGLLTDL